MIQIRGERRPGDIGYAIYLHALLYAQECGFDHTFEEHVASSFVEFTQNGHPEADRLWVAERDGERVGCVGIIRRAEDQAQLRWLLVHPSCRGQGLGRRLVEGALAHCREQGFRSVYLWTVSGLEAAIHLYRALGFRKTEEKTGPIWGQVRTQERYDLPLQIQEERDDRRHQAAP